MAELLSREDEIKLNPVTGKVEKKSIIISQMSVEELRQYRERLAQHAKAMGIELNSINSELTRIDRLLGGAK